MDENNGVDVDKEKAPSEEENLQNEENSSEEQASDAAASDEPAADSSVSEEKAVEGDAEDEAGGEPSSDEDSADVSQDEEAALLNQEDVVDESAADAEDDASAADNAAGDADAADVDSGDSGLLSQEEVDNAIEQGEHEDSKEGQEDAGGDEGMSQEEIDAAINSAVGDLEGDDFSATEHNPEVKEADFQQLSSSNKTGGQRNIDLLMDVELPVSIELGKTSMDISDILALGPGSVVELEKLVGEPVDLLVNNKCVARGEVVVVEENFGLRITQLISPEERIKNLQ